MLLKSGSGGGGGRDVIFRLIALADPASKQAFTQFGNEIANQQKKITAVAAQETKKQADNKVKTEKKAAADSLKEQTKAMQQEAREAQRRDKTIADNYLKTHLRAIDDKAKAERKSAEETARHMARIRANSAQLEQAEGIRLKREARQEQERAAKNDARNVRTEQRLDRRREHAWGNVIGGAGNLARGAAYSGLVGSQNTETILNTVLGVEGAASIYKGGKGLVEGIGTLSTGGKAVGGAALSAGGSAIAAVAAPLAALAGVVTATVSAFLTAKEALKHGVGGGATVGGAVDKVATWEAKALAQTMGRLPAVAGGEFSGLRGSDAKTQAINDAYAKYDKQGNLIGGTKFVQQEAMKSQVSSLGELGAFRRQASQGNLSASQQMLGGDVGRFQQISAGGKDSAAAMAAYNNVRQSMEQVRTLSLEAARAQVQGSQAQLENLRAAHGEAKQIADEARRGYESDIARAGVADHDTQLRIREIARKRASGEDLNRVELDTASQFTEFRDYSKSQNERLADQNGLGDIFAGQKERAAEAAKRETELAKQVVTAELNIKTNHEVTVHLEGQNFVDQLREKFGEVIGNQFADFEEKTGRMIENKFKEGQTTFANARRPT